MRSRVWEILACVPGPLGFAFPFVILPIVGEASVEITHYTGRVFFLFFRLIDVYREFVIPLLLLLTVCALIYQCWNSEWRKRLNWFEYLCWIVNWFYAVLGGLAWLVIGVLHGGPVPG